MTYVHITLDYVQYVYFWSNFRKIEFGGSCGHGDRYGQHGQHSWQVCDARSARGDLAVTSTGRSAPQLDSRRHPKLMKINRISLIFIGFH